MKYKGYSKVISLINLKGGVGKTTSAVNIASTLAQKQVTIRGKRRPASVLLIDLDPQSNASLTLLSKEEYNKLDQEDKTLYQLFKHEIDRDDSEELFDLSEIRIKPFEELNLELLPSSVKLIDIQDKLLEYKRYYLSATDILCNSLNNLKNLDKRAYTHIIIDCPPSLGLTSLNGLSCSDYYIVPTLLDAYSHWGLDKIKERIDKLKTCNTSCELEMLGVLYSNVDVRSKIENEKWQKQFQQWEEEFQDWLANTAGEKKNIIFKSQITSSEIVRSAEAANCPLSIYEPETPELKIEKEKKLLEWNDLVQEILFRIGMISGDDLYFY